MRDKHLNDAGLEDFFAAARQSAPEPSEALLRRVMAAAAPLPTPVRAAQKIGRMARLLVAVGGWGGVGGLASAGIAGLWIGFADAGDISALAPVLWGGSGAVELMPGIDDITALAATEG